MTALWISFAALYALGMLWLAYQIRTAPSDLELWGEEIEYTVKIIIICTLYIIYRLMRR